MGYTKSPIYSRVLSLLIEMPSLNRNERVECLVCGREYTHKDVSRHRRTCNVLKCSNSNFYTYSNEELTYHIKKLSSCQQNVKFRKNAQQSRNTLQEKKINVFFYIKT